MNPNSDGSSIRIRGFHGSFIIARRTDLFQTGSEYPPKNLTQPPLSHELEQLKPNHDAF